MSGCKIPQDKIEETIAFHGHFCPGLAIGIRVSELALERLDNPPAPEMVAICEADMCGVDAIQYLTGCTFGKGNLIHRDYGKVAFSFFDRRNGKGFRALLKRESRGNFDDEYGPLSEKISSGQGTEADKQRLVDLRDILKQHMLEIDLETMFQVTDLPPRPPRPAHILKTLICDACGEGTMESRTRRLNGQTLCIPCFEAVEQKV